jgi:hypothetical protein
MTLDRYADLFDDDLDDVADRLDRLRSEVCGPAADFCGLNALGGYPPLKVDRRNVPARSLSNEWRRGESNP